MAISDEVRDYDKDEISFMNEVRKNYLLSLKGLKHAELELERLHKFAINKSMLENFELAIETAESEINVAGRFAPDINTLNHGFQDLSPDLRHRILEYFPTTTENFKTTNEDLFDRVGISEADLVVCDVVGDSMIGAGIKSSDLLLANSFEIPENGKIVIAEIDGKLYVKRYSVIGGVVHLISENPDYEPIIINSHHKFRIKGVVKHILSKI
ncbi:MAG: S24 family peptidase [Candidatus Kapabacteria bacterium]|nr:S24 family peptidase [Candidatus Kapabacteria bacterium]